MGAENGTEFWGYAAVLSKRIASKIKLAGAFVGGDIVTTKEDLEQEGLMAAAGWISRHGDDLAGDQTGLWRSVIHGIINTAIFSHLKEINRNSGRAFSASDWLENIGDDGNDLLTRFVEQPTEPEEAAQDTLDEIIENNENDALKTSITCLDKEMQAIVLLHNDGFSTRQIGKRINRHRERARQLYHEAMRKLRAHVERVALPGELPLSCADSSEPETLLYSSQAEKLRELKFRPKSTQGNISHSTRLMRQAASGQGQMSLF